MTRIYPFSITDEQWQYIKELLPAGNTISDNLCNKLSRKDGVETATNPDENGIKAERLYEVCFRDWYKKTGRPRSVSTYDMVNAILYVVVGGIQWRMLPKEYPNWKTVYHYFRIWKKQGVWQGIHDRLRALARQKAGKHKHATAGCLDSQSVKVSAHAGERSFDGGKKINGKKRHILTS